MWGGTCNDSPLIPFTCDRIIRRLEILWSQEICFNYGSVEIYFIFNRGLVSLFFNLDDWWTRICKYVNSNDYIFYDQMWWLKHFFSLHKDKVSVPEFNGHVIEFRWIMRVSLYYCIIIIWWQFIIDNPPLSTRNRKTKNRLSDKSVLSSHTFCKSILQLLNCKLASKTYHVLKVEDIWIEDWYSVFFTIFYNLQ